MRLSYEEFLQMWLLTIKPSLKYTTWYQYEMTSSRHIIPYIGAIKIINLRPEHIQNFYNRKLKDNVGIRTIQVIHTVIHKSLKHAMKLGVIHRNPSEAVNIPRKKTMEMNILSEIEINQLLNYLHGTRYEALYHLAIATGLRQSELLGLKWSDLDWNKRSLIVQRQLKRKFKPTDLFDSFKTHHSRRTITIGIRSLEILQRHLIIQNKEKAKVVKRWKDNDLMFPSSVGTPISQRNLFRHFKNILRKLGLPIIRFHDLRHTAASLMLNYGIPPIIVSRRLGHSKVSITLDIYGHLIPEMQDEAAKLIDDLIIPEQVDFQPGCTRLHTNPNNDF